MAKATKTQAKQVYDNFFGTLRNLNGGTVDENRRQAPWCHEMLSAFADEAQRLASNPNKRLSEDAWLMEAISETIPARLNAFRSRYGF